MQIGTASSLRSARLWNSSSRRQALSAPSFFVGMIVATIRAKTAEARALVALSMPIVLLITAQGLMSRALANWAVGAYAAGVLLAVPVLASRRWLIGSTLVLGSIVAIALPLMTIAGTGLRLPNGELAMARYLGRSELVSTGLSRAREAGADAIVANDRSILAELFYQLREEKQVLPRALPETGVPSSHYALLYPLKAGEAKNPLYLAIADSLPACFGGERRRLRAGPQGLASSKAGRLASGGFRHNAFRGMPMDNDLATCALPSG